MFFTFTYFLELRYKKIISGNLKSMDKFDELYGKETGTSRGRLEGKSTN
jgi:hypothetical protein